MGQSLTLYYSIGQISSFAFHHIDNLYFKKNLAQHFRMTKMAFSPSITPIRPFKQKLGQECRNP